MIICKQLHLHDTFDKTVSIAKPIRNCLFLIFMISFSFNTVFTGFKDKSMIISTILQFQ